MAPLAPRVWVWNNPLHKPECLFDNTDFKKPDIIQIVL